MGPARTQAAGSINAATQKAVVDGVRAALEDADAAASQQQQQGRAEECPGAQQASSSTDRKKRREESVVDASQVNTLENSDQAATQPTMCQAPPAAVQGGAIVVDKTHDKYVDSCGSKQRPDALAKRVCPEFDNFAVQELSLCHMLDRHVGHSCRTAADCGVDSVTCRARDCSVHGFCQQEPK